MNNGISALISKDRFPLSPFVHRRRNINKRCKSMYKHDDTTFDGNKFLMAEFVQKYQSIDKKFV
jgi:hypothetical protein